MIAPLVVALGALRHYVWPLLPDAAQGPAWKACSALCIIGLGLLIWRQNRRAPLLGAALLWFAFEELQVVLCSVAYAMEPWPVPPGMGVCSAAAGFDIGAAGILLMALISWKTCKFLQVASSNKT